MEEDVHDDIKVIKEIFQEMSDIVDEKENNYAQTISNDYIT